MKNNGLTAAARKVNASIQEAIRKLTEDTASPGTPEPPPHGRTARGAKKPGAKRSDQ